MFVWKVRTFLKELERHMPALHQGLEEVRESIGSGTEADTVRSLFSRLPSCSIDYRRDGKRPTGPLSSRRTSAGRTWELGRPEGD